MREKPYGPVKPAEKAQRVPMTEREFVIAYVLARASHMVDFTPYGAARKARDVWKQEIAIIPN